jgi:hypothetical protein
MLLNNSINLTPSQGWIKPPLTFSYASANDPQYVVTVSGDHENVFLKGMRVRLTDNSTTKYFIITDSSYTGPNTEIVLYGGTDYDLSGGAITNVYISSDRFPYDFPNDPNKWTVKVTSTIEVSQNNPSAGTWYNLGSLSIDIPVGSWNVSFKVICQVDDTSADNTGRQHVTLSTTTNSETDAEMSASHMFSLSGQSGNPLLINTHNVDKDITIAIKDTYYLLSQASNAVANIKFRGDRGTTVIKARSLFF